MQNFCLMSKEITELSLSLQQLQKTVLLKCKNMTMMDRMQLWKNIVQLLHGNHIKLLSGTAYLTLIMKNCKH